MCHLCIILQLAEDISMIVQTYLCLGYIIRLASKTKIMRLETQWQVGNTLRLFRITKDVALLVIVISPASVDVRSECNRYLSSKFNPAP